MSTQLEVIKFRDLIPVTSIPRVVPGFQNTTVEILGEDFNSVESVWINDIQVPEFIIVSKNKLWAQLPTEASTIQIVEVRSSNFTRTNMASKILFEVGTRTRKIEGLLKLVQLFTKWMLQSPGSDIFNPERGGGLQQLVGKVVSSKKMEPILAVISRSVDQTSLQIRTAQASARNLPLSERLLTANLIGVNVNEDKMEAAARVRVVSMAGDDAVSALTL